MRKGLLGLLWALLGVGVGVLVVGTQPRVHALPEYSTRTGEPCATCHVNPAGGGPRTARSGLWIAQGRPDQVPQPPGTAGAPATESADSGDGAALYEKLGCAACHGDAAEGGSGPALNMPGDAKAAEQAIRNGQGTMMAYGPDKLSDTALAAIVEFVRSLAKGNATEAAGPAPQSRGPAELVCSDPAAPGTAPAAATASSQSCGGN